MVEATIFRNWLISFIDWCILMSHYVRQVAARESSREGDNIDLEATGVDALGCKKCHSPQVEPNSPVEKL